MNKKSVGSKEAAEKLVKNIRRRTSRKYSATKYQCFRHSTAFCRSSIFFKAVIKALLESISDRGFSHATHIC